MKRLIQFCTNGEQARQDPLFLIDLALSLKVYILGIIAFGCYGIMYATYFDFPQGVIACILVVALQTSLPLIIRKTGKLEVSNFLLVVSSMAVVVFVVFHTEGFFSPGLTWLTIFPLIGTAFGRLKLSLVAFFITMMTMGILILMKFSDVNFAVDISPEKMVMFQIFAIVGTTVTTTVLSYFFINAIQQTGMNLKNEKMRYIDLLRTVTHDIATPLTIMGGNMYLLQKKLGENSEVASNLAALSRSILIASTILKNVREMDAIESGKKEFALRPIQPGKVLGDCRFLFEKRLKEKNIVLMDNFAQYSSVNVMAEEVSLGAQVFSNILSNAIKFSFVGAKIEVTLEELGNRVVINFRDYGVGIPNHLLENIFDYAARTNRVGTNGEIGTGFGMPLVKSYIQKYGGEVEIVSNENGIQKFGGQGTLVRLFLQRGSCE